MEMARDIHCAKCGIKLITQLRAIPNEARVIIVVAPHVCKEEDIEKLNWEKLEKKEEVSKKDVDELLDSFPFVQKLNKGAMERETVIIKDKRDKKHLREELITSSAPTSILEAVNAKTL
jgi:hypothetical protein